MPFVPLTLISVWLFQIIFLNLTLSLHWNWIGNSTCSGSLSAIVHIWGHCGMWWCDWPIQWGHWMAVDICRDKRVTPQWLPSCSQGKGNCKVIWGLLCMISHWTRQKGTVGLMRSGTIAATLEKWVTVESETFW